MAKADDTKRLRRKVRNSYMVSTISIAMVLFLIGSVGYLILNAMKASDRMKENVTIHVMLRDNIDDQANKDIGTRLSEREEVREVKYVPKEQAAEDFKGYIGNDFEEFLAFNPLPDSYEVKMNSRFSDQKHLHELEKEVMKWKGTEEVVYQKAVVEQVGSNINKFNLVLLLFGGALFFIAIILLNNTIRLSIYSKRYLINTMKLVGASKWFIMKPFVGRSVLSGIYAWLIAGVMFLLLVAGLGEGLPEMTSLTDYRLVAIIIGVMLLLGITISVLFTIFAVNKFVRMNSSKVYLY